MHARAVFLVRRGAVGKRSGFKIGLRDFRLYFNFRRFHVRIHINVGDPAVAVHRKCLSVRIHILQFAFRVNDEHAPVCGRILNIAVRQHRAGRARRRLCVRHDSAAIYREYVAGRRGDLAFGNVAGSLECKRRFRQRSLNRIGRDRWNDIRVHAGSPRVVRRGKRVAVQRCVYLGRFPVDAGKHALDRFRNVVGEQIVRRDRCILDRGERVRSRLYGFGYFFARFHRRLDHRLYGGVHLHDARFIQSGERVAQRGYLRRLAVLTGRRLHQRVDLLQFADRFGILPAVCKHTGLVGGFHDRIVVLLARSVGLLFIPCGQLVHRLYPGVAVLHGLNRLVARVVGFVQRIGKRAEALRCGGECIVECIRALRAARKRRVYAVQYALECIVAVGHQLVFDLDRVPFVHQGLQARDLIIAQVAVLLFGKDRFNLFVDLVQPFNVAVQIADQIAARRFAQLGKAVSDRVGVVRKAGNRRVHDFLRFRLAVRPCGDGGFQPVLHAVRAVHLKIVRAQLKRG